MAKTIKVKATDGSTVEFVDEVIGSGAMKDVYFSPDKSYVVGFFKKPLDANGKERLESIVGRYREQIFTPAEKEFWEKLLCWPTKIVVWEGKTGIVVPAYHKCFFFEDGNFKGKEKEGKWFASAKLRNRHLDAKYKGTWLSHFRMLIKIARAVKRLHAAGLAHSDLSYKNVLVDPLSGSACVIDCDGLVVPGRYPPDVVGTPDFIAPEVLETKMLALTDPKRKHPCIQTDRHALAVMVYMYLLYRHPLRGGKIHDADPTRDEELMMGARALFIEHPTDKSNRPKIADLHPKELPQGDVTKLPYTICGPYLRELFDRAFIDGLHDPSKRPTAEEWLTALVKTTDLLQPCQNPKCEYKWFVFDNSTKPVCPFCGTPYRGQLPVLNLFYSPKAGKFIKENYRLMVYHQQTLYKWHVNKYIFPSEKLSADDQKPVGDFHFHNGRWILINRRLPNMRDITDNNKVIKIGEKVELTEGRKILLGTDNGDRLIHVQLVSN